MTWVKIDDHLHGHPKVQAAWQSYRASIGLHLLALSHAGAYLTDGHVPETFVRGHLPGQAERRRAVAALVNAGLWEPVSGGWTIHDYLDFNESRDEIQARRDGALVRAGARPAARTRAPGGADARARVPTRPDPSPYPFPGLTRERSESSTFS